MDQRFGPEVFPPDSDHYIRLADAFFHMPPTPESRLQRDVWNRLNALNKKKLEKIEKARAKLERVQRAEQMAQERQQRRRASEQSGASKGRRRDIWRGRLKRWKEQLPVFYRDHIMSLINRMFRSMAFLLWWWQILNFRPGRPLFGTRIAMVMP